MKEDLHCTNIDTMRNINPIVMYLCLPSRFALLAAQAFLQLEIPVRLFNRVTPTPYVPFTIAEYGCAAGVMVTASHNPKEDNGYKVVSSC